MSLRTWSRRKLGFLWLAGLALEASLVGAGMVQARRDAARADAEWEHSISPPGQLLVPPSADALERLERLERAGVKLEMHGDTVKRVTLSPEAQHDAREMGEVVGQVGRAMAPAIGQALALTAAVYLAVPVSLIALTLAWVFARRRARAIELAA